jgi:lipoate-protein ligase A
VRPRLLIQSKMEGRLAMAVDEGLVEAAGEERPAVARLYGFSPPTLSLGRFQRVKGLIDPGKLREDGVTRVRRPTGGHAVLHDDELTYCLVVSKTEAERLAGSSRKRAVYAFIAGILVKGLELLGVKGMISSALAGDMRNPDCFASTGEFEIKSAAGKKLIGSAQMTTRKAVLQHGSIPISNPMGRVERYIQGVGETKPQPASSLSEEAGRPFSFEEVREAFAEAFRSMIGAEESALTPEEDRIARGLLLSRYDTDEWNLQY